MAARFWVTGGTGNWNSTTNWSATTGGASGASVPSTSDTAAFDASSGAGTATLDISPTIQTLTMTGFTGTLAFGTNTISLNSTGAIFTGATTMTVTGTPLIICTNSGSSNRTIAPTVVTEANSISFRITAGTGAVACSPGAVRDMDFTDGTNPTGYAGQITTFAVTIYGNFKASTGMTASSSTNTFTFAATSGTKTINTAGVTFDRPFTFNGVGGTWQLQAALTSGATRTVTLTNGTLDLASYTLTTGLFSSSNSNVRTLAFGTGKIVLTGTSGTIFTYGTFANLTVTGTSLVQATSGGAGTRTLTFGTGAISEANSINFEITSGSDIVSLGGTGGAAKNINFTGFTGTIDIPSTKTIYGNFDAGSATSITGTSIITFAATSGTKTIRTNALTYSGGFNFNGVGGSWSLQDALTLSSTATLTLTAGTLNLVSYTLTTGLFNSSNSNTRVLAFGTGKIVLTGTGVNIWSNATGTGFTFTGTSRIEAFGPSTTGTRQILPSTVATSAEATALSFYITGGSDTISFTTTSRRVNILDFTGFTGTFTNSATTVHGNYTISNGMTVGSGTEITTFATTTSQNITTNGKTFDFPVTFNGIGGTFVMQDALTLGSTQTLTLTNGTLQSNGYAISTGDFASAGTGTRALSLSAGSIVLTDTGTVWTTSGTGFSMGSTDKISLSTATAQTLSGGGVSLGTVSIGNAATKTITGSNTFHNIVNTVTPATVNFEASSTNSFSNFNLNGTSGSLVTLRSTVLGTQYTLAII
jgi:hypothetical protein